MLSCCSSLDSILGFPYTRTFLFGLSRLLSHFFVAVSVRWAYSFIFYSAVFYSLSLWYGFVGVCCCCCCLTLVFGSVFLLRFCLSLSLWCVCVYLFGFLHVFLFASVSLSPLLAYIQLVVGGCFRVCHCNGWFSVYYECTRFFGQNYAVVLSVLQYRITFALDWMHWLQDSPTLFNFLCVWAWVSWRIFTERPNFHFVRKESRSWFFTLSLFCVHTYCNYRCKK